MMSNFVLIHACLDTVSVNSGIFAIANAFILASGGHPTFL